MNENRLTDYLDHMRQAATDACGFVEDLSKEDFLADTLKTNVDLQCRDAGIKFTCL